MARQQAALKVGGSVERNARSANPIDAHVGSRVRMRRMLLGLSQEKLADKLGLTFQQVQKYEKGTNRIGASRLFEMAGLLGVGINYFYEDVQPGNGALHMVPGFSEESGQTVIVDFLNTREGVELNRAFLKITDAKVRRSVIDLIRALAREDGPAE